MPGIPALQLRGFAELDSARRVSASKAKTFQFTGQTLLLNKSGKAYEAETKPKLTFRITLLQLLFRSKIGPAEWSNH